MTVRPAITLGETIFRAEPKTPLSQLVTKEADMNPRKKPSAEPVIAANPIFLN